MKQRAWVISLALATHLPQTIAMVAVATVGAMIAGVTGWKVALVAAAVLSGQVSVGWSNDYIDAKVDAQLERPDKPVVRDQLDPATLRIPIAVSLVALVPLSFLAGGPVGGTAHVLAVASAWAYNLFLSRTIWSWAPYVVSFSLLSVFVLQSASTSLWPSPSLLALASLVGVIAHLLNALPDIDRDIRAGVGGLAVTLGKRATLLFALVLAVLAGALLLVSVFAGQP